ncbi:hsp20/alpha crystallin family protein [Sarocladium implicatum]|nr:hsp20/alpha crystallin family protein [Sarocladium implicatum]
MAYQQQDPLWDFIRSFDPNTGAANTNDNNGPPEFLRGFPFFNHPAYAGGQHPTGHHAAGPHPHRGPGHHGRGGRRHQGPPPHAWAGGPFAWGEWPGSAPWFQPPQPQQQQQQQQQTTQPSRDAPQQTQQQSQQEKPAQEKETEKDNKAPASPDTMTVDSDVPDPAVVTPDESDNEAPNTTSNNPPPYARGQRCRGRRHRDRRSQPETPFPFDLSSLLSNLSSHPIIQNLQTQANSSSSSSDFTPPLDLFSTASAYILHLSLPGVQKSDVGVDWDPERSVLRIAGVVHRPGDEEFQATLVQGERRVGAFAREVVLPPGGEKGKEEVDGDAITAKMEDGVLVVTVPKVEKEWTEIRKVDIE